MQVTPVPLKEHILVVDPTPEDLLWKMGWGWEWLSKERSGSGKKLDPRVLEP